MEVNGSDSLAKRNIIDVRPGSCHPISRRGHPHSDSLPYDDPAFQAVIEEAVGVIDSEEAFGRAMPAQPGMDGQTVMIQAGASGRSD